jgi:spore protease
MNGIQSDLAVEIYQSLMRNNSHPEGIKCSKETQQGVLIERVHVFSQEGSRITGKPQGHYITLNTGKLWLDEQGRRKEKVYVFRNVFRSLLEDKIKPDSTVLVAGLGNRSITADAIGPATVKSLIVTRHIRKQKPKLFQDLGLFDVCALTPGVLGQTGIESADVIRSVVNQIRPDLLVVIDALASRELKRLVTTVQLCDSGIRPGSGIGNTRPALIPEELGIPVLTVGIPTVVDAATLAADAIHSFSGKEADVDAIRAQWSKNDLNFFVTPKETDQIIHEMGSFLAHGINLAFNESLSYEDMLSLIG